MKRAFILIVTTNQDFERIARSAVRGTDFEIWTAQNIRDACRDLLSGTGRIALAIIDVDMDTRGLSLLRVLREWKPPFPLLAVTNGFDCSPEDEIFADLSMECLTPGGNGLELQWKILELCGINQERGRDRGSFLEDRLPCLQRAWG